MAAGAEGLHDIQSNVRAVFQAEDYAKTWFKVGHVFQVAKVCSVYVYVCFCVFTRVSTEAQLNLLTEKRNM